MNIKINKRARLLYLLLACFLLFGFLFLPFQRSKVSADELSPDNLFNTTNNYLLDLNQVILYNGSSYVALDYPKPISHDKLQYYYDNNISAYFNKRVYGYVVNGAEIDQSPSYDIKFGAGSDNVNPIGDYFIRKNDFSSNLAVPYYKSNSYIPINSANVTRVYCTFNDSVVSLGDYLDSQVINAPLFNGRGFNIYFIGSSSSVPFNVEITLRYRYFYNCTEIPTLSAPGVPLSKFYNTDYITRKVIFNSNSNGVAGGLVYSPSVLSPVEYDNDYLVLGNYGCYYRYITDFSIECVCSSSVRQVSFTNYAYELPPSEALNFINVIDNTIVNTEEFNSFDLGTFLLTSINNFFSFQIFPGMSLAGILAVVVAIPLAIMILKFFAGG